MRREVRRARTQELTSSVHRDRSYEQPRTSRKISAMATMGEDGRRNAIVTAGMRDEGCLVDDYIPAPSTRKTSTNPLSKLFHRLKT